jgi:ferredoxin
MRVFVDLDRCEGHGMCVLAAPEVFDLDDEGLLHYDPTPPEELRAAVEDAVRSCPVAAITVDSPSAADGVGPDTGAVPTSPDGSR